MMNFKKWVSCQLGSKFLLSARPFCFFVDDPPNGDTMNQGTVDGTNIGDVVSQGTNNSADSQITETTATPLVTSSTSGLAQLNNDDRSTDPLKKVESLQIKFLRLVHRLGESTDDNTVAQALYRLQLASLIRAGESDVKRPNLTIHKVRAKAAEQEATGGPGLDFSIKILLLGKTGVGKSATLNSIFDENKVSTNAFQPATNSIQEVVGYVKGIKVTVIDTPGLSASNCNQRRNRKLVHSIRHFVRRSPPDIVLYCDQLDHMNRGYNDKPLLKLITEVFGSSIWFSTVIVMTHSSSSPPESLDGYPVNFDAFVRYHTNVIQRHIQQAASNTRLENPVLLVENHPSCRTNLKGEKVLPNGQAWKSRLLLLCAAMKVLGEANSILKFQDTWQLTPANNRLPSLPHLLSSLLRPRCLFESTGIDGEIDEVCDDGEDEYDQLPPIRVLTKAQYQKLPKAQKAAYLDELDYRETLYLKKQYKELRKQKIAMDQSSDDYESSAFGEVMQVSDMAVPLSFDSADPIYRYRCLLGDDQWVSRPVLDTHGWDHDVGFDGINLEASLDLRRNIKASLVGQMSKDKEDLSVQSECAAKYTTSEGHLAEGGIDIQSTGKDLICTVHGDARFHNLSWNVTGAGFSVTKFGNMHLVGAKLEDSVALGRRFQLTMNIGRMGGCDQVAHGGSFEAAVTGKDYPAREEKVSFGGTLLSFDKETVLSGSFQSAFRVRRGTKMSVGANLNSRRLGQICVRTSTSEHVEIALIAVITLIRALFRRRSSDNVEEIQ